MLKKLLSLMLIITLLTGALPVSALAGEHTDYVLQVSQMKYIGYLSGMLDGAPVYRSGTELTANMNGLQVEKCLDELLRQSIESTLRNLEDLVTYGLRNESDLSKLEQAQSLLTELRLIRTQVKACYETVAYDRVFIYEQSMLLADGETYVTEHDRELVAHEIIVRTQELEAQIALAANSYAAWSAVVNEAEDRLVQAASMQNLLLSTGVEDMLQDQLIQLRAGRVVELSHVAEQEPSSGGKDIVIDVVGINEIRIYAMDVAGNPLPDATVYCWPVDKAAQGHGQALKPNEKGYVTVPILALNADEDYLMNIGYEVSCPGYRTQYAEANWYFGGEIFWCYLEENDPMDDVYVAGVSLNGYDCLWRDKTMYITDQNTARQMVKVYLRSQSGEPVDGSVTLTYLDGKTGQQKEMTAAYSGKDPTASFAATLCRDVAVDQPQAFSLSLSGSRTNGEIHPQLTTKKALNEKSSYTEDNSIIGAIFSQKLSFNFNNVPLLNNLHVNLDLMKMFEGHAMVFKDVSGLWVGILSTGNQPYGEIGDAINTGWMTEDSLKVKVKAEIAARHSSESVHNLESGFKREMARTHTNSVFGGAGLYWNLMFVIGGNPHLKGGLLVTGAFQAALRGDWKATVYAGAFPFLFCYGFEFSVTTIVKARLKVEFTHDTLTDDVGLKIKLNCFDWDLVFRAMVYGSVGSGISVHLFGRDMNLGLGLRFTATLTFFVPLVHKGEGSRPDRTMNFGLCLSVYADVLVVHFVWDIWSGSIEYNFDTRLWGKWINKPFWNKESKAVPGGISALEDLPLLSGENEEEKTELHHQDDLGGTTLWPYSSKKFSTDADSLPVFFSLSWQGNEDYSSKNDYAFWVEQGRYVKYANASSSEVVAYSFAMPDDVQRGVYSGAYRVLGISAATSPEVFTVPVRMAHVITNRKVQVAAVSVTIGTEWETRTIQGDAQETVEVPTASIVVTRLFIPEMNYLSQLRALNDDGILSDVMYVDRFNEGILNTTTYLFHIELVPYDEHPGVLEQTIVMKPTTAAPIVSFATCPNRTGLGTRVCYFTHSDSGSTNLHGTDVDGSVIKTLPGGGGKMGFLFALTDESEVVAICADRGTVRYVLDDLDAGGKISDLSVLRTGRVENERTDYELFFTVEKDGTTMLKGVSFSATSSGSMDVHEITDFDVDIGNRHFYCSRLLDDDFLYWFEGGEDKNGKRVTRVTGVAYSLEKNMLTAPYCLGILSGEDGTPPTGFDYASDPIDSYVMNDGRILMTKAWMKTGESSSSHHAYATYQVAPVRRAYVELMSVDTEKPAVSAGRTADLLFTLENKGNLPLVGFDFDVYHNNAQGEKELVQRSHIDLINKDACQVTYMKHGYSSGTMAVFEGDTAIRRVPGLFDMMNKDAWNVTRDVADNSRRVELVTLPALMPEGVHPYTMAFWVPIDWANETTITCEVYQVYAPEHVSDIFGLAPAQTQDDASSVRVLALSAPDDVNGADAVNAPARMIDAGTLASFHQVDLEDAAWLTAARIQSPDPIVFDPNEAVSHFNVADLAISVRMFTQRGVPYAAISINQSGQTDHRSGRGVTLRTYVEDERFPTYTYTFKTHHVDGQLVYHMTLPVSVLCGNRYVDVLRVAVSDTVEGNEELSTLDNVTVLHLNQALKLIQQPQPVTVREYENAEFTVTASGGIKPYLYMWQHWKDGHWVTFDHAAGETLTLPRVTRDMNGMLLRCVVEDAADGHVVSQQVMLTVNPIDIPVTGDTAQPVLWLLLFLTSLAVMILLCRHRRNGYHSTCHRNV